MIKGSKKQIKWAIDIKTQIETGFKSLKGNEVADKAIDFILNIEDSKFWIEIATSYTDNVIALLMKFARGGILLKGYGFNDKAKIDEKTGEITLTNEER